MSRTHQRRVNADDLYIKYVSPRIPSSFVVAAAIAVDGSSIITSINHHHLQAKEGNARYPFRDNNIRPRAAAASAAVYNLWGARYFSRRNEDL